MVCVFNNPNVGLYHYFKTRLGKGEKKQKKIIQHLLASKHKIFEEWRAWSAPKKRRYSKMPTSETLIKLV